MRSVCLCNIFPPCEKSTTQRVVKSLLSVRFDRDAGTLLDYKRRTMSVVVLGVSHPGWHDVHELSWHALSASSNPLRPPLLTRLASGTLIDRVEKNFIDWRSDDTSDQLELVGHLTLHTRHPTRTKTIDVSDYVERMLKRRIASKPATTRLTFLIYRPFRHESVAIDDAKSSKKKKKKKTTKQTNASSSSSDDDTYLADDLSGGARVDFDGASSLHPPELIQLWSTISDDHANPSGGVGVGRKPEFG